MWVWAGLGWVSGRYSATLGCMVGFGWVWGSGRVALG